MRSSAAFKAVLLVVLYLFVVIRLSQIHDLRSEREVRQMEVNDEIAAQWGKSQSVIGPILVVPASYEEVVSESIFERGVETIRKKTITRRITVYMLSDRFELEADLETEWLYRGIFRSPIYKSRAHLKGWWSPPDMKELGHSEAEPERWAAFLGGRVWGVFYVRDFAATEFAPIFRMATEEIVMLFLLLLSL